jgi:predicted RNase H-like HicB family nuclease
VAPCSCSSLPKGVLHTRDARRGLPRDDQFLVGGDDVGLERRGRGADAALRPDRGGRIRTMKAYDFKVLLEPDETGRYVATCPSLPGCDSQGDTIDGALDNIREAIELCLEDAG